MSFFTKATLIVCVVLALCGCGAGRTSVRGTQAAETDSPAGPFTPASYVARPTLGIGSKYANLLSPDTYVIWFSDEVAELKAELEAAEGATSEGSEELLRIAKTLNEKYLILECHIVSAFPDSSIAYDVTSFRHADVFLLDDAGTKYEPLQMIIGTLERGNKDALMQFSRVNLVVFPKHDLFTGEPVIDSRMQGISLVISGYKTTYFFSWDNLSTGPRLSKTGRHLQALGATGLREFESAFRFLVENFK